MVQLIKDKSESYTKKVFGLTRMSLIQCMNRQCRFIRALYLANLRDVFDI